MEKQPGNSISLNLIIKEFNLSIGAELGVRRGDLCSYLLKENENLKILTVDIWDNHNDLNESHDHQNNYAIYKEKIKEFSSRVIEYKMLTTEACKYVEDESLDFIFIDATHTHKGFTDDYKCWINKVKPNGLIAGHDYCKDFDNGGLKKAIDELVGIEIVLPRTEDDYAATPEILQILKFTDKGVADSQSGCWFKWKRNIKSK